VQEGRLNEISHQSILRALDHRARQFKCKEKFRCANDNLISWPLDETGTIDSSLLLNRTEMDERMALVELQKKVRVDELGISEEVLKVHGVAPATKGEGIIRLIYENTNGFSNRLSNNKKINKAKEIHNELNVDIAAYCAYRLNMRNKHNINGFNQLFKGGEAAIQSIVAHNTHKNIG
jgi:hypothetical protein